MIRIINLFCENCKKITKHFQKLDNEKVKNTCSKCHTKSIEKN